MPKGTCSVPDCDEPFRARGVCKAHWRKLPPLHEPKRRCEIDGCGEKHYAKGVCVRHYRVASYRRDIEASRKARQERYAANVEREREWKRNQDREGARAYFRAYRASHPDEARDAWNRRRARKLGNGCERISYVAIIKRDGMICHICGSAIESRADLHFDHVIPLAKGGPHSAANIKPSHALCNMRKGDRLI